MAILAEPSAANAAAGSLASITPQSCESKNFTKRTWGGRSAASYLMLSTIKIIGETIELSIVKENKSFQVFG